MAPLTPHWNQPSHPEIQKVIFSQNKDEFTSKSVSLIDVPPFGVYAKLDFPPCTKAEMPTYATVQMGKEAHLNLNSDLVYINHACEPSVIFDMSALSILAGPKGLKKGEEITFFYPSTEWDMAQGFDCFCGAEKCKGWIGGAKSMEKGQLEGLWLNIHIRELLAERDASVRGGGSEEKSVKDPMQEALKMALEQAKAVVEAAQKALDTYQSLNGRYEYENGVDKNGMKGRVRENGVGSRELSGEMGGDTKADV